MKKYIIGFVFIYLLFSVLGASFNPFAWRELVRYIGVVIMLTVLFGIWMVIYLSTDKLY